MRTRLSPNSFFWGFLTCLGMGLLMANAPIYLKDDKDADIYRFIQKPNFMVQQSTPLASNLLDGQPYWFYSGGRVWLKVKVNNEIHSILLNKE